MKPLLRKLSEVSPPSINWIGTSYGLTRELFQFWKKNEFSPVYLKQSRNDLTAEHNVIMLKGVEQEEQEVNSDWLSHFTSDFTCRFLRLMSFEFRSLHLQLALNILNPALSTNTQESSHQLLTKDHLQQLINLNDLNRLRAYKTNMIDYHVILDLLPTIA